MATPGDLARVSSEDDVPEASRLLEAPATAQAEPTGTAEVTSTTLNRALAVAADITFDPQAAASAAGAASQGQPASTGGAAPKQAAPAKAKAASAKNQAAPPASGAPKPGASRKAATPASSDPEQSTAAIAAEEPVPDRIKKLRASTQGVLKKICDWHNDPESNRKSLWRKQGLAIPVSLVQEAGFERGVLLTQLKEIKVVVFADGKASAMHTINNTLYFMVTREAALAIGFKADPEPEAEPQAQEASE